MKKLLLIIVLPLLFPLIIYSQGTLLKGAQVNITEGTVLTNNGDLQFEEDGAAQPSLILSGKCVVTGDLVNNASQTNVISGIGPLWFAGAAMQQISGTAGTLLPVIILSNALHLQINTDISVSDSIRFIDGQLLLESAALTVESTGDIFNANASSYINPNNGHLTRTISNDGVPVAYPLGGANYNPLTLSVPVSGVAGLFSVEHLETVFGDGTTGNDLAAAADPIVEVSWVVTAPNNDPYDLGLEWVSGDEDPLFDRDNCYVSQYSTAWNSLGANTAAGSNPYTINQTGVSGSSVFGIGSQGFLLPMDWLAFSGTANNEGGLVHWETANEEDVSHYVIKRSADSKQWVAAGSIPARNGEGPFRYSYFDLWPQQMQSYYYQMVSVDLNGKTSESTIIQIERKLPTTAIASISTHFLHQTPTITWLASKATRVSVTMVDATGRIVYSQLINPSTQPSFSLSVKDGLATGTYFLQLHDDIGNSTTFTLQLLPL